MLWAPRLGFSWDVKGDASIKISGTAGRYYIPIAGNTSVRMAGGESNLAENFYYWDGQLDEATGLPANGLGARINPTFNEPNLVVPNPQTVAATNLSPMYQDEFILGAQFEMPGDWMLGLRGISREVKAGMDDICMHKPLQRWAEHAEHIFGPVARDKGLEFKVELAASCPTSITTDGKRVEQILNNLLGNALKFTLQGTVSLRMAALQPKRSAGPGD